MKVELFSFEVDYERIFDQLAAEQLLGLERRLRTMSMLLKRLLSCSPWHGPKTPAGSDWTQG